MKYHVCLLIMGRGLHRDERGQTCRGCITISHPAIISLPLTRYKHPSPNLGKDCATARSGNSQSSWCASGGISCYAGQHRASAPKEVRRGVFRVQHVKTNTHPVNDADKTPRPLFGSPGTSLLEITVQKRRHLLRESFSLGRCNRAMAAFRRG